MQGILLIDKEKSWTSFDVVNYVRRMVADQMGVKPKNLKVGHIGTLDPLATGLLVLLIGKEYTKQATIMSKMDKVYKVDVCFGKVTDSFDSETEVRSFSDIIPNDTEVNEVVRSFVGNIEQMPPAFSALKVDGKRAYSLARSGLVPELKLRPVTIYSIEDIKYEYPKLSFVTNVSSGTYIRSLVNDIGLVLGCGAYMSGLKRVSIGSYLLENSVSTNNLSAEIISSHLIF
jgi:tRNA pseudouridine55 synthase